MFKCVTNIFITILEFHFFSGKKFMNLNFTWWKTVYKNIDYPSLNVPFPESLVGEPILGSCIRFCEESRTFGPLGPGHSD
jgi:hypothetical protein